jgi:hypothetical protein
MRQWSRFGVNGALEKPIYELYELCEHRYAYQPVMLLNRFSFIAKRLKLSTVFESRVLACFCPGHYLNGT